jgi:hypothetical protein
MKTKGAATLALCAAIAAAVNAQTPPADTDLSCFTSLLLPTTGAFAARAGTSGTVRARFAIGKQGELSSLDIMGENQVLNAEVRVALSLSQAAARCKNRTVELVFAFTLKDPMTDYIAPPGVRFMPPNRFELTFLRVRPNIDSAPPSSAPEKVNPASP